MASWNFGGTVNATNYYCGPWPAGDNFWYTDGLGMPTTRASLTGTTPIYVADIGIAWTSGPLSDATIVYQSVETSGGSTFGSSGGVAQLRARFNGGGTLSVGRNTAAGGSTTCNRTGTARAGLLVGSMSYAQVASAPGSITAIPGPSSGTVRVDFTGSADSGDSTISAYIIQSATSLAGPWTTQLSTGTGTNNVISMPPGMYYWRVYANNGVGSSVATATASAVAPTGGGQRFNGTSWGGLVTGKRFNGTSWVDLTTRKRFNGTAWVDLTN